jgi:hypothetical protein
MLLQNYFLNRDKNPIESISQILDKLNEILIHQVDELHTQNEKIDYWQHPLEALSFKLSSHIASLRNLLSQSSMPYRGTRLSIMDISSINIIIRAIIENYLTLYHFHFEPIPSNQKEFRFLIYVVSALKNRQAFSTSTPENKAQKERDIIEIGKFQEQLKVNSYFIRLPVKEQKRYLSTKEAKELNWITLLDNSDLKPEIFKDIWRLQSNYAHSEFLSVLQIREHPKDLNQNAHLMALLGSMILATAINNLGKLFISSKNIIETFDTDNKSLFSYFLEIGTKRNA